MSVRPACTASLLFVIALVACGELHSQPFTTMAPTAEAPPFATGSRTASTDEVVAPCPTKRPFDNSPCDRQGQACEYGDDPDPSCNTHVVCERDPDYGQYWSTRAEGACAIDRCPVSGWSMIGACEVGDAGSASAEALCTDRSGKLCGCTTGADGAHVHAREWVCVDVAKAGCPNDRPMEGAACTAEVICDYGNCSFKSGSRMVCRQRVWVTEGAPCP